MINKNLRASKPIKRTVNHDGGVVLKIPVASTAGNQS